MYTEPMGNDFNRDEAKKFLQAKETSENAKKEVERKATLQKVITLLKKEFQGSCVEVYLIGSILQPFRFSSHSDIDIVLKNYPGDRFDIWTKLEEETQKKVEVIPFETCRFQEFVLKNGFKVV